MKDRVRPSWEVYERLIARLVVNQIGSGLCVTPNVRVRGKVSGTIRQLDVVIENRHDRDDLRRIVVDAKARRRKIDVKDVESFLGLMHDVEATHGYLVCPAGYTKAAEHRAQSGISLRLIPLDRIGDFDPSKWPRCLKGRCTIGRVFWDGYPELSLALHPSSPIHRSLASVSYVHYVGKCDRCASFHVRCLTCGEIMMVAEDNPVDIGHQCRCRLPWFWIASTETGRKRNQSAELHVVMGTGEIRTVDRRPL